MITAGTSEITKRAAATRRQRNTQDPSFSELLGHALEHHWKPRCRTWKQMEQTFNAYTAGWKHRRLSTVRKIDVMERHGRIGRENGPYVANRWRSLIHRLYEIAASDFDFPGANPARRGVRRNSQLPFANLRAA